MKSTLENILFSLFGLWLTLTPSIMLIKIKYLKALRKKEFNGIGELFSFFRQSEWWIAGLTCYFPLLGREENSELNQIRKSANLLLYFFYLTILTQSILAGILKNID